MRLSPSVGVEHLGLDGVGVEVEHRAREGGGIVVREVLNVGFEHRYPVHCELSLYPILQLLSVTLFETTPVLQALQPIDSQDLRGDSGNQLNLFNL